MANIISSHSETVTKTVEVEEVVSFDVRLSRGEMEVIHSLIGVSAGYVSGISMVKLYDPMSDALGFDRPKYNITDQDGETVTFLELEEKA